MDGNLTAKRLTNVASFIDSNVLVYAEAVDEPKKQSLALALLRRLRLDGSGVISTQVLQEYCNVGLRKLGLNVAHLRLQIRSHEQFEVVQVTPAIIHVALDLHQTRSISFYDALILQAAITSGCDTLYSEDLNAGEIINGVKIVNPFLEAST
jgi:predicted nucleic acid-binding protein